MFFIITNQKKCVQQHLRLRNLIRFICFELYNIMI